MDEPPFNDMRIDERPVEPDKLYHLIDQSDRVVVRESPGRTPQILYESRRREDLEALKESIRIHTPLKEIHCMCYGRPALYLYRGSEQLAQVTNHHGTHIRTSLWYSDTFLVSPEKWVRWFADRGMEEPGRELAKASARVRQNVEAPHQG